jgi:hypothetical protein
MLSHAGKAYLAGPNASDDAVVFFVLIYIHVAVVISLHIISFIFTGNIEHLECMIMWLAVPLAIFVVCFFSGDKVPYQSPSALAIPCGWLAAWIFSGFTVNIIGWGPYNFYYGRLTASTGNSTR